jgi:hypothetical protein
MENRTFELLQQTSLLPYTLGAASLLFELRAGVKAGHPARCTQPGPHLMQEGWRHSQGGQGFGADESDIAKE